MFKKCRTINCVLYIKLFDTLCIFSSPHRSNEFVGFSHRIVKKKPIARIEAKKSNK